MNLGNRPSYGCGAAIYTPQREARLYCANIGCVASGRFGWARATRTRGEILALAKRLQPPGGLPHPLLRGPATAPQPCVGGARSRWEGRDPRAGQNLTR